jgi:hypothetical protein
METQNKWVRQPQECKGDYWFNGRAYITTHVANELPQEEINQIVSDLKEFVQNEQGTDYLQVYKHSDGRKIFCIDQLSQTMMQSGNYTKEEIKDYNYWTILFAEDY